VDVRPPTILLTVLTAVFGAATIVLAVRVGPGNALGFVQVLRVGTLIISHAISDSIGAGSRSGQFVTP
jgi:hypothetical protein